MASKKVEFLKSRLRNTYPSISVERARLVTEFYRRPSIETPISRKAHMLEYLLANMTIYINPESIFVGDHGERYRSVPAYPEWGSNWILEDIDTFDHRSTDNMCWAKPEDKEELIAICEEWKGRGFREVVDSHLTEEMKQASLDGLITIGSRIVSTASHMPNYGEVMKKGFRRMIGEIQEKLDSIPHYDYVTQEQKDTWEGMLVTLKAAVHFAHRYAELAEQMSQSEADPIRKAELNRIAETCWRVPELPPRTFYEAMQFFWFIHLIYQIENAGHNHSIGRFDQFMYPYFKHDIDAGIATEEDIVEMIQCMLIKWTEIFELRDHIEAEAYAGFPMWTNITIGGIDEEGKNACNRLTHLFLDAADGAETTQPAISFRYNKKIDEPTFRKVLQLIQKGLGQPAVFNDEINIPRVLANGCNDIREARNYAIEGCVEAQVPGKTDFRPVAGFINILKVLELTMHNGMDPKTGRQFGPETGCMEEMDSMEQFMEAYKKQLSYIIDFHLNAYGICSALHSQICPTVFASTLVDGCIEKGRILQKDGAKYSSTGTFISGVANVADSLAVIDQVVFRQKRMTLKEMTEILDQNFEGNEVWHQMFLNKYEHFGNDSDLVDDYCRRVVTYCADENLKHRDSRFGQYELILLNQTYNIWQGRVVGATPDGRLDGEPLANNASPSNGMDRSGPTAVGNSIGKMDTLMVPKGVLVNHKFDPAVARGEKGLAMLESFVRAYCDAGGQHLQINVVDTETLRDAQKHPENYKHLMVRVAGYSAFFIELDPRVQENIIGRTEHGSTC
ncbi:glycyl radical protein [Faecalicatena contorta]|uniref:glycyl radical protein n=1 Tax=Faecalicatena contorta TaxID=39482 RepID=UPI003216C295